MSIRKNISAAFLCTAFGLSLVSCGGNDKEMRNFGEKISSFAVNNELDSIKAYYPSMAFESINPVVPGDIIVEKGSEGETVKVLLAENVWILVNNNNGVLEIADSHGLAKFPEEQIQLAKTTSMYEENITDNEFNSRLIDPLFLEYLKDKTYEKLAGNIVMEPGLIKRPFSHNCEGWDVSWPISVTNNGTSPLAGNSYQIIYTEEYETCTDDSSPNEFRERKKEGVDVAPGETKIITLFQPCSFDMHDPHLEFSVSKDEYFKQNFVPTGNEYQEYLSTQKEG